jgi:glucose-1-phosphate thymidylyltransferase
MLAGIRDILVISTPEDTPRFEALLGDGSQFGISLSYTVQHKPEGLAHAFIVGANFIGGQNCAMVLGDNIFYGTDLQAKLQRAAKRSKGATVFAYAVKDPRRYGVIELDDGERPLSIEEKPDSPKSRYAVTGLYFFDSGVTDLAKSLTPSPRGELEITDLNKRYLERGDLHVELFGRGTAWIDTGTHDSLLAASNFVKTLEERQGLKVCCPEEIAYHMGYLNAQQLADIAAPLAGSGYGDYLLSLLEDGA